MVRSRGSRFTRRQVIGGLLGTAAAGALAACGATPTPAVVEKVVEKEVTKIVEGTPVVVKETVIVKETQVVEVTPTVAASTGPVVITLYTWLGAEQFAGFDDWIKGFTDANPDIKIQLIPSVGATIESDQKLQSMVLAGNSPDVLGCTQNNHVLQGMMLSLQPFIERDAYDLSVFPAGPLSAALFNNELYWIPDHMGADNAAWVYNKTMFADAGVEPPPTKWNDPAWTWDEWVARAKLLTLDTNGDGTPDQYGQGDMGYYTETTTMFDAFWCDQNDINKITTDTPENLDWATRYQDLFCKDMIVPTADMRSGWGPVDVFLAGKVAMSMIGSWVFKDYDKSEIDWDFMPFPMAKKACPTMMLICAPGILKGSKFPDQAWKFVQWNADWNHTALFGGVPAMPKYFDRWAQETFKNHTGVTTSLMVEGVEASLPSDNIGWHPCFPEMTDKVIYPQIQQLELCQIQPKEMLTNWQTELQAISDACQPTAAADCGCVRT